MSESPESAPPPAGGSPASGAPDKDAKLWAMLSHLIPIVLGPVAFVAPLVIWLAKKDEWPFVDDQAKEPLNFQITIVILYAVATLILCGLGGVLYILVWVLQLIFCLLAGIKANDGERYRYPFAIRLIK
jgi:uncharacterized Tic20 family protein